MAFVWYGTFIIWAYLCSQTLALATKEMSGVHLRISATQVGYDNLTPQKMLVSIHFQFFRYGLKYNIFALT